VGGAGLLLSVIATLPASGISMLIGWMVVGVVGYSSSVVYKIQKKYAMLRHK